jgi:hypothetical protein
LINNQIKQVTNIIEYNYNNCEKIYSTKTDSFFIKKDYINNINQKVLDCDKMYEETNLYIQIDNNIKNKIDSPLLYNYQFIN